MKTNAAVAFAAGKPLEVDLEGPKAGEVLVNHSVLPEASLAKVREDTPFEKICYIGCGVTTGIGAVAFTTKVEPGRLPYSAWAVSV